MLQNFGISDTGILKTEYWGKKVNLSNLLSKSYLDTKNALQNDQRFD